jgi:hypothetical protein
MEGDGSDQERRLVAGTNGFPVAPVADAAQARETILDARVQEGDDRPGLPALIGEDHGDSQVRGDLRGDRFGQRSDVAE